MALKEEIEKIVHSAYPDPFEILGAHVIKWGGQGVCGCPRLSSRRRRGGRGRSPQSGQEYPMKRLHKDGFFEALDTEQERGVSLPAEENR